MNKGKNKLMLNIENTYKLGTELTSILYPEEAVAYQVFGKNIIQNALTGNKPQNKEPNRKQFEFGDSAVLILNISIVLVNLITAITQYKTVKTENKKESKKTSKQVIINNYVLLMQQEEKFNQEAIESTLQIIKPKIELIIKE